MQAYVLTEPERELARRIQGDLPIEKRPFRAIGETIGLGEEDVISAIGHLKDLGVIRKFAAIVRHRRVGYERNAMVVWSVPVEKCESVGKRFAAFKEITHCYERAPAFKGKYNLFTMIHFRTDSAQNFIQELATLSGIDDFLILESEEEYKKSSMAYF